MPVIDEYINNYIDKTIEKKIGEMFDRLQRVSDNKKVVYTNKDMMQMLGVDPRTLKKYRDEGLLGYSHPYDKYYYTQQDLDRFLMNKKVRFEPFDI